MSDVDQFITITATNERTARYFLDRAHGVLNDAIASFFDLGESAIPRSFRPDLIKAKPVIPPKQPAPSPVLKVPTIEKKDVLVPTLVNIDPSIVKELPPMVPVQPEKIKDLEINGLSEKEEKKHEPKSLSKYSYRMNESPVKDDKITIRDLNMKIESRKNEFKHVDLILWADGYSLDGSFTPQNQDEYKETLEKIQSGAFPSNKEASFVDFNLIDNRSNPFTKSEAVPANPLFLPEINEAERAN